MTTAAKKAKTGRPRTGDEKLAVTTFRCSTAQREKLQTLGGASWIRAKIDTAKLPC